MAARKSPPWERHEIAILREFYPQGGLDAVTDLLADRSWHAIHVKAHKLGLRCEKVTDAPKGKLQGDDLEEAIRLREDDKWGFARIGAKFGISEASACNAVVAALCTRRGYTPAQRDEHGRLTEEGIARLRLALKKGLKGIDIQLRLGLSAGRIAEERRRYNRDLKARGLALLPPPGGGEQYSGVRLGRTQRAEVEALLMQGLGSKKINERTGVSHTSIGRIRARLVKRLKRKGETLPGCDAQGVRHVQAESARFVPDECKAAFRALLLDAVPTRRAAELTVIGLSTAYRLRDQFALELRAEGKELPAPKLPGRVRGGGYPRSPDWPPRGAADIYAFRQMMGELGFDAAKARWRADRRAARQAEAVRPKSFEEQLARVARGEIGIAPAMQRRHLENTRLPMEARP